MKIDDIDNLIKEKEKDGWEYLETLGIKGPAITYMYMSTSTGKLIVNWIEKGNKHNKSYKKQGLIYWAYVFPKENDDSFAIVLYKKTSS